MSPNDMPTFEVPNSHVTDAARQFREIAELLFKQLEQHQCVLPLLMVAGFAIELYLKALNTRLVYHESGFGAGYRVTAKPLKKGHSLVKLFDALHPAFQQALQDACAAKGKPSIKEALAAHDEIFENARYIFEDGRKLGDSSINSLVELASLVGDYVQSIPRRSM
jgi:hypothetical protein